MGSPFYSRIAQQWHEATGIHGGPFKKYILNAAILNAIGSVNESCILEIGAGNGYFIPLALRHFEGQKPSKVVITDRSGALLGLAQENFQVSGAEYSVLDASKPFPFSASSFDLIIATMVFNELPSTALTTALYECHRVLRNSGKLIATVTHPDFIESLRMNGKLSQLGPEFWTMPAKGMLRVPVVPRSETEYHSLLTEAGFTYSSQALYPSQEVLDARPGLRHAGDVPLGLTFTCTRC